MNDAVAVFVGVVEVRALNVAIGRVVRAFRQDVGVTQAQLAAALGVSRAHVVNLEAGRFTWKVTHLVAAARAVDVSAGLLLDQCVRSALSGGKDP